MISSRPSSASPTACASNSSAPTPQPLALCPAADDLWLWALLELAPTPAAAHCLTRPRLDRLSRAHRIRRFTANDLLAQLRTPALMNAP